MRAGFLNTRANRNSAICATKKLAVMMCLLLIVTQLLFPAWALAQQEPFVPISPKDKELYRFDFKKLFYVDDAARQKDIKEYQTLKTRLMEIKPQATASADKLLEALDLYQRMGIVSERVYAYGGLRYAVNTNDTEVESEGEKISDDFEAATAFLRIAVQALDDDKVQAFLKSTPSLAQYRFLMQGWRRGKNHTGSETQETLLAQLYTPLNPFDKPFYTLMSAHLPEQTLSIGDRSVNVTQPGGYSEILRVQDRSLRESGFRKRLAAYKADSDLYAFALLNKIKTANAISDLHDFPDAVAASLFSHYLDPKTVDPVLKAFKDHSSLAIRFQKAERAYQQKLLGLDRAEPWDMEVRPAGVPEPRFSISDASAIVIGATKSLKQDYQDELQALLNPANGRLDVVPGENRQAGDFAWGSYGPTHVFYMNGYNGYPADVVVLGHEAAHVVHHALMYKSKVPWCYSDGARYFTEGFAKVNELLVLDYLLKNSKTESDRLFYLREINSKLASVKFASMYWAAYATSFEVEAYRRVKEGKLTKPEEIHEIWAELGRTWVLDFDKFPDSKYTWAATHHFFDVPRYYSNYLFAWLLAVTLYERFQSEPASIDKYIALMKSGFQDEPANLLRDYLAIDLSDPKTLDRTFAVVEKRLQEFEKLVN